MGAPREGNFTTVSLRATLVFPLLALFLVACSSSPRSEFRVDPLFEGKSLTPRDRPAEILRVSEHAWVADGYVPIGTIVVRHEEGESHTLDPTSEARREAAVHGGDAVVLRSDNATTEETRYMEGRCLRETLQQRWVNDYETVCDHSVRPPACSQRQKGGHMESTAVCVERERVPYTVRVVKSEARVYRRDANLATQMSGQMLIGAIQAGQTKRALEMIAQGADLNARGKKGETALGAAAGKGDRAVVSSLLRHRVDVDGGAAGWETPLTRAAEGGHTDVVRQLIVAGAAERGDKGATALLAAASGGHVEIARLLRARGARLDSSEAASPLRTAAKDGEIEVVRLLLGLGADVNARSAGGYTALMSAAQGGHAEVVQLLLAQGASVRAKSSDNGYTALFYAVESGSLMTVRALIAAGADVNARTGAYGRSVLQVAIAKQAVDIVSILRSAGATR